MAKILIVDDEASILEVISGMLAPEGHEVMTAIDARGALALLETFEPDAVFVDLVMPGKGGLTLIMESLAQRKNLAVIAMSGRIPVGSDAMHGLGNTLRIASFLTKPFTAEEVRSALASALSKRE